MWKDGIAGETLKGGDLWVRRRKEGGLLDVEEVAEEEEVDVRVSM